MTELRAGPDRRLQDWIGRSEEVRDTIDLRRAEALHAALDLPGDPPRKGDPLPPLWRWLYFHTPLRRGDLGRDGAPERGRGLIPPVRPPRRMWVAGRFRFQRPLMLGAAATRLSSVADITRRERRAGLGSVASLSETRLTLRHEIMTRDGAAETEEQDILFQHPAARAADAEARLQEARRDEAWRRVWTADPILLHRFSALTANSHRIHYDLDYCRDVEGHDGLVAHPPLLAFLMLTLARDEGVDRSVAAFEFRLISPVVHTEAFEVCGRPFTGRALAAETGEAPGGGRSKRDAPIREADGADLWIRAAAPSGRWSRRLAMVGRLLYR
ncbi:MAG: acyl-CoA dehydrogenase [Pseudomonadota bacterium]